MITDKEFLKYVGMIAVVYCTKENIPRAKKFAKKILVKESLKKRMLPRA